ncbi:ECF transporter S component [Thermohalobacter berrensis]|uniref:Pantothenate ECF transporter n=1 Tax=Thermohalobacter berrensis TaxID=99594 RepID=A0A419T8X0_9FIRM|nr:ECF transporter S component [Thermohalobacter berrensis]RKD33868.1 pantothenate ECF transporter [Thermohalobacter berrensis]
MIKKGLSSNEGSNKYFTIRRMAIIGVLGGISAILGLTPIGFIPVGPTRATIMHIPVIIGAIMEGPLVGAMVGAIFGLFSIIQAITNPTPISFVFLNPLVSVLPRILIGITAYYSYIFFKKLGNKASIASLTVMWGLALAYLVKNLISGLNQDISSTNLFLNGLLILLSILIGYFSYKKMKVKAIEVVIAAAIGTLTNTIGVLSMIYTLYAESFVEKIGANPEVAGKVILGIGLTNGLPEIIIAMIIVTSVVMSLKRKIPREE